MSASLALRLLLASSLLISSLPAMAADIANAVRERLDSPALLRGQFAQSKSITGFKKPLLSNGDFLFWRDHGVIWHTKKPFDSMLTLTPRVLASSQNGNTTMRMDTRNEPTLATMNETLLALLAGDIDNLKQRFHLDGELSGAHKWTLRLIPKDKGMATVISQIELSGDRNVQRVVLQENNNDTSTILFSQLSASPAASADEAKLLCD